MIKAPLPIGDPRLSYSEMLKRSPFTPATQACLESPEHSGCVRPDDARIPRPYKIDEKADPRFPSAPTQAQ